MCGTIETLKIRKSEKNNKKNKKYKMKLKQEKRTIHDYREYLTKTYLLEQTTTATLN